MNKSVLMGIVALGGLILIVAVLPDKTGVENNQENKQEESVVLAVPTDLPGFPIYPGEVRSVRDTDGETARDVSVTIATSDSIKDINDWYREVLSQGGWSIKSDKNVAGYQIIQGENNNLYTSMQSAKNGEEVLISQHLKVRK